MTVFVATRTFACAVTINNIANVANASLNLPVPFGLPRGATLATQVVVFPGAEPSMRPVLTNAMKQDIE